MSGEGIRWRSITAVWWRNFHFYRHSWYLNVLPNFFEPLLYLLALGLGLGWYVREIHGIAYVVYLTPALIMMATINGASFEATWNIYVRMNRDRRYDAILTTPVNEHEIVCGELLWAITRATLYGLAFLIVAALFGLVTSLTVLWLLPLIPLTGYLLATIGMSYAMWIPTMDLFGFYWTCFMTPMFLLSDTFFPIADRLPSWAVAIAQVTPILHCVQLARAASLGTWHPKLIGDIAYILLAIPLLHWLAARLFVRRLHRPAR
ncbi:MAG: ABC transporter permease [Deltaproteobacteria bacterium]|nr:ABC transporter permease [Deltaproteobacteria bacterium]